MNILALDPATKTGYAHSNGLSGVWDYTHKLDQSPGLRLLKFRRDLERFREKYGIDLVGYEAPRGFGMQRALVSHSEFQGIIKAFCEEHKILYRGYSSTQIKKHATGGGTASKDQMKEAAAFMFAPTMIIDDNHADALWILDITTKEFT